MPCPPSPPQAPHRRLAAGSLVAGCALLLTLSGCSSGDSSSATSDGAGAVAAPTAANGFGDRATAAKADVGSGVAPSVRAASRARALDAPLGQALIKTAAVTLESDDVASVVAKVDELVARTGGEIASEDTSTNTRGVEVSSRIVLRVPVAEFDRAVDEIARLADLVSKSRSSRDVTSRVVDVNSRVTSAKDSIAQLRTLFSRATKLGDVIALERELSTREADLEALQAQQQSLAARTRMSTITVNVSKPSTTPPRPHEQPAGGFVSGLKQGWDSLVAFVVAFSHGVGVVLPLGTLALCAALLAYVVVRRFTPRRVPPESTSE